MKRNLMVVAAVRRDARRGGWSRPAAAKSAKPAIDPEAMQALHKMGAFLRDQQKFSVRAIMTTDDLLASGQKVQFNGTVELMVRRPDRLRMDIRSDRRDQRLFYDGKSFTIFDEPAGYYASFQAPPTLAELKDVTEKRYGIDMPLADLFYWGTEHDGTADVTGATKVGVSTVAGTACDHYAFRQKDVDWELWIEQGNTRCRASWSSPPPRKRRARSPAKSSNGTCPRSLAMSCSSSRRRQRRTRSISNREPAGSHGQGKEGGTQ